MIISDLQKHHLLYLASPYSKFEAGIWPAYKEIARIGGLLTARGLSVFSPIAHTHPLAIYANLDPLDWQLWMKADAPFCRMCTALIVARMGGWQESKGVEEELKIFKEAGKPIYSLDPATLQIVEGCE